MTATTASAIFTAAHAAAKVASAVVAYKVRFSTALKAAWAAAKQTITTTMKKVLATITGSKDAAGFTPAYDVFHQATEQVSSAYNPARTTLFTMQQPLDAEDIARFVLFSTEPADRRSKPTVVLNGTALYARTGEGLRVASLDNERIQQAYGFSAADVAAFKQAAGL